MTQRDSAVALKKVVVVLALCLYISAFSVVMPVRGAFSSVVITDVEPTEFHPGETKEVVLTVKNEGGDDAKDVKLEFQVQDAEYVSLVGPTVLQINTLNSWCSKEVKITVHVKEGTPTGVYCLPIKCEWVEYSVVSGYGYVAEGKKSAQLGISFSVKGDVIINVGKVYTEPVHVRPGDEDVEIHVAVLNTGEAAAKDVEAKLICNEQFEPSWSGTDREYIGGLEPGGGAWAIFNVDVADKINAKMYSIPLYIVYKDTKNIPYGIKTSIDVLVERKPELEIVSSYTEHENISAGDYAILHVRVRNVGSEEAESVSVRVTGEADVPFDFAVKSDHIGNLKVNETGDAILEFDVDKDAAKRIYPLGLEIRCVGDRDLGDDKVYTFDKQIQVEVTSSSSSIPGFECLFILIALILTFIMRRKRV
nr:hypothetical protein, secreted [uncultured archaeon]CBH37670.1 conserved hypothetical membrane protein [uncultured archaeon]CBH39987.1 hypothetical membrane protein [uncultured archaeon]